MKARFPISLLAAFVLSNANVCFAADSASGAWSSKFPTPPSANAPAYAFATIGTNFYVGGQFTEIGGVHARRLARFDGQNWSEVGGGVTGDYWTMVHALCADGTNLYVGGFFTEVGGLAAANIAKWAGDHWESLGDGVSAVLNASTFMPAVQALYVQDSNLYVGGRFNYVSGIAATNIARWDGVQWHSLGNGVSLPLPSGLQTSQDSDHVSTLTGDGTNIYVGGQFSRAGPLQTTNVARWDGSQWQSMAATFDEGLMGTGSSGDALIWNNVESLSWHKNTLYVGGDFQKIAGQPAIGLARWDGSSWQVPVLLEGGQVLPVIKSILSVGEKLYAVGSFDRVNGQPSTNAFILQDDIMTPLNCPMFLNIYGGRFELGAFGDRVFFGGDFWSADSTTAANFVEITESGLKPLGTVVGAAAPNYSRAVATDGTNIFVAGDYARVAKWDGAKWSTAQAIIPSERMNHVAVIGSNVFVAGNFSSAALGVTNFARWDGQSWKPVGNASTTTLDAMLALGSKLYVTGTFSDTATSCKWWDGTNWTRIAWFPQTFNTGQRLATDGTNIFIAREDTNAGQPMVRVARWNGSTVFQLPSNVPLRRLSAIAANGAGEIWVAGSNSDNPYDGNHSLYRWTEAGWVEWSNVVEADADIRVMTGFGKNIIAAGSFKTFAGIVANSVAQWNGTSWQPLDGGVTTLDYQGSVLDLAVVGNRLAITGEFDMAGRTSSGNVAVWTTASSIQFNSTLTPFGAVELSGSIGDRVEIEASDSLANWTKIADIQFSSPTQQFTDPAPASSPRRFYRAKIVEP